MKKGNICLVDLDFEYKLWKSRLQLFIKEVDILRNRNIEIQSQPNHPSLNAVELMVLDDHEDLLNKLYKRIINQEEQLHFYNKDFPIDESHPYFIDHVALRMRMNDMTRLHFDKIADVVKELGL